MKNSPQHSPRSCLLTCAFASLAALLLLACPLPAAAQETDTAWNALKASYFHDKQLEPAPFIRLSAPTRAASGDQVPFAFSIDHPMTADRFIRKVTLLVDANPVPVSAVFHFTPHHGKAEIATRIRFDTDSPVHVVAEASDGRTYVNSVMVKASGGCGGPAPNNDAAALADAGKMKMALDGPFKAGDINKARLLIRHPMYTGLQRDLATNGFRPAFFISKIDVAFNGKPVLTADTAIGISENPSIGFSFYADKPGALQVVLHDNKGATFRQSVDVGG